MKSTCENCSTEYRHAPSRNQRFCSRDCYLAWNRGRNHPQWVERCTFNTSSQGYEVWHDNREGDDVHVKVHRLLAVCEYGFDTVANADVHHNTYIPWDNRPAAIELRGHREHSAMHGRVKP